MNRTMSRYLRIFKWLLLIVAAVTFVLSVTLLPELAKWAAWRFVGFDFLEWPLLIFIWVTSVGFYYIILLTINICSNAQNGKTLAMTTVKLFDRIALVALAELAAYIAGFVAVAISINFAHPTFILLLFMVAFVCLMLFGFCKVMKYMIIRAIELKEDSEYTI